MDPRGKEKKRPAKNNLAAHSRKGEVQNHVAVLGRGAHCNLVPRVSHLRDPGNKVAARTAAQDRNRWIAHVEALCANLALGDR